MGLERWSQFAYRFGEYYKSANLWTPPRLRTREWMLVPFGNKVPRRHQSFDSLNMVKKYFVQRPPSSAFYSTAYYSRPSELKMVDKGWRGADLIFDLDGDHLPGVSDQDFSGMLNEIQNKAWELWNDYLEPEFGFDKKYLQVTFSGHRGFHLHYRDPKLFHLNSEARREIVGHITGVGVDMKTILNPNNNSNWSTKLRSSYPKLIEKLAEIEEGGISKDALNSLLEEMQKVSSRSSNDGKSIKYTKKNLLDLAQKFHNEDRKNAVIKGDLNRLGHRKGMDFFWVNAFRNFAISNQGIALGAAGETDEVVTVDVKRVIRYPTSLHGKSGLRVTEFPVERLDPDVSNSFDALSETVVFSNSNQMYVKITMDDINFRIREKSFELNSGDEVHVSEAIGTFLVLKGWGVQLTK